MPSTKFSPFLIPHMAFPRSRASFDDQQSFIFSFLQTRKSDTWNKSIDVFRDLLFLIQV